MQTPENHYFNIAKIAAQLRDVKVIRQKDGDLTQLILKYGGGKLSPHFPVDIDAAVLWLGYFYPTAQVVNINPQRIIVNLPKV